MGKAMTIRANNNNISLYILPAIFTILYSMSVARSFIPTATLTRFMIIKVKSSIRPRHIETIIHFILCSVVLTAHRSITH